jgi:hypothetical protein
LLASGAFRVASNSSNVARGLCGRLGVSALGSRCLPPVRSGRLATPRTLLVAYMAGLAWLRSGRGACLRCVPEGLQLSGRCLNFWPAWRGCVRVKFPCLRCVPGGLQIFRRCSLFGRLSMAALGSRCLPTVFFRVACKSSNVAWIFGRLKEGTFGLKCLPPVRSGWLAHFPAWLV